MNARRGFWRLWVVVSLAWVMFVFVYGFLSETRVPFFQILPSIVDGRAAERELAVVPQEVLRGGPAW